MTTEKNTLRSYLATLATDPGCYYNFLTDPAGAATEAGLSAADQALLFSGDEGKIYLALAKEDHSKG